MKLMFGWNMHTHMYHILKIGQGLRPHLSNSEKAKRMYITLCPRKDYNAIQFIGTRLWNYIYPNHSNPALTINTLCKDCLKLYPDRDKVLSTLINIKLGIKYEV